MQPTTATCSPILQLAPELLASVFLHCLPPDVAPALKEAPLLLCHICRHWRQIALTTPRLWASISLTRRQPNPRDAPMLIDWLDKSGTLPLSITIKYDWSNATVRNPSIVRFDAWVPLVTPVAEAVFQYAQRWQALELTVPVVSIQPIPEVLSNGAPMLERITIHETPSMKWSGGPYTIDLVPAPRLTHVTVFNTSAFRPSFGTCTMHHLRGLHLSSAVQDYSISMDACIALLLCSPALESFFYIVNNPAPLEYIGSMLELRRLTTFTLMAADAIDVAPFLDHLSLPVVRKLSLSMMEVPKTEHWPHLTALLQRSQHLVETLDIEETPLMERDFLACLREVPRLRELVVDTVPLTDTALRALCPPPAHQDRGAGAEPEFLCPLLESAELSFCRSFTQAGLAEFIAARWRAAAHASADGDRPRTFVRVQVYHCGFHGMDDFPVVAECQKEGLVFCASQ